MTRALPEGWEWVELGDVLSAIEGGKSFRCEERPPTGSECGLVKISAVTKGEFDQGQSKTVLDLSQLDERARISIGDFLMSRANTIELVGACAVVRSLELNLYLSDKVLRLRLPEELKTWAWRWLGSKRGRKEIEERSSGNQMSMRNIGQEAIRSLPLPLPPLSEQRRIVEKIEALTARSGRAREALASLPALLDRYRAAVLAAAFRGDLTAEWREEHGDAEDWDERAEAIAQLRRRDWQGRRYAPGEPAEHVVDHAIPDSWGRLSIDELSVMVQYGTSAKTSDTHEVPVLRMGNIQDGQLDFTDLKYLPADHDEFPDLLLVPGDILFNRTNSAELVGKTAVYSGQASPCSFASYLIRVRVVGILPELVSAYINSPFGRSWVRDTVSQQVGQANVNGSKLKGLAIPVPPEGEQRAILDALRTAEDRLRCLWETVTKGSDQLSTLDSAILAKAFRGELVPQDPNDEPASMLLERIRAERAAAGATPKRGRGRKRAAE